VAGVGVLLQSCCVAAVDVFIGEDSSLLQFFLYGLLWSLQLMLIALYLPYDSLKRNVQNVLVGFATLVHSAIFLGVQQGGLSSGYMFALAALFALILVVLLFREKLATNAPWLRVLRRADMKKQEAAIIETARKVEFQLAHARSSLIQPVVPQQVSSAARDTPRPLIVTSPGFTADDAAAEGQQPGAVSELYAAPPKLTWQLDADYERELAARRNSVLPLSSPYDREGKLPSPQRGSSSSRVSPASPSFHHHGVLLGPGELFMPRASSITTAHSNSVPSPARLQSRPLGSTVLEPLPPSHRSRISLPPLVRADGTLLVSQPRAPVALANLRL